jgi:Fungal specific transcription factor domain
MDQAALRSHSQSRSSWALIGLAVRIAHGLGIHKDGDGQAFSAFDAEMRRRLWWNILVLDVNISEDRGSRPMISEASFNTRMPSNLNEVDFGYVSQHPLLDKKGITDIVSCLLTMETSNTSRRINHIPIGNEQLALTLKQKEEMVRQCIARIETHYLAGCDPTQRSQWLLSMTARLLVLKLWTYVQYPLQSHKSDTQHHIRGQSLRIIVEVLTLTDAIEEDESAAPFQWYFRGSVPWHALAVALVELCKESHGTLADRAWQIIDEKWSERIAAMKEDMLARSLQSLFQKARAVRQQQQQRPTPEQFTNTTIETMNWEPLWHSMPFESLPWENESFVGVDISNSTVDLDDWNTFILDANTADLEPPLASYGDWLTDV